MKKKIKNVNTAVQVTQLLYKLSVPYSENLQWDSYYPVTFWQSEDDVEEKQSEKEDEEEEEEEVEEGWAWMSDFSVDSWLPISSTEEDVFPTEEDSPIDSGWESYLWGDDWSAN